ncbi:MAG: radical SAM protein [Treponemataceae bacterium]
MYSHILYESCSCCPRNCMSLRNKAIQGFCQQDAQLTVAWIGLHFGEEPLITVNGGSGTIFVSGCNLQCTFCQNYQISQQGMGKALSLHEFADLCLKLQDAGAENINIITGSHAAPFLLEGLLLAKKQGLTLAVCWNCSAYETIKTLEMLSEVVDIWLPDLKSLNPLITQELFKARDYPQVATRAIKWIIDHTPLQIIESNNDKQKMLKGVIIRHLILPGRFEDSHDVIKWFVENVKDNTYISLMTQYTPVPFNKEEMKKRSLALSAFQNRYIEQKEFNKMKKLLNTYAIEKGFFQELVQDSSWLPDFKHRTPFSSDLAKTIWHWKQ